MGKTRLVGSVGRLVYRHGMVTPRIRTIVDFVGQAGVAADIGCDHGYAALALVKEGRAAKVIACDISEASLQKTVELVGRHGLSAVVETRLGDGLSVLGENEADTILIAGMGGMLIRTMLEAEPGRARQAKRLVLAPNRNEAELRQYLLENGFSIIGERLARDGGRYYQVLCVQPGGDAPEEDEFYYHIGRRLIEGKDPLLAEFLGKRIEEIEHILFAAQKGRKTGEYMAKVSQRKEKMEEVLKCL